MNYKIILIFILIAININANIFIINFFDYNYFQIDSIIINSNDTISIPINKFENTGFILITDIYLRTNLFLGPDEWNYNTKEFLFYFEDSFFNETQYTFSDFFNNNFSFSKSLFDFLCQSHINKKYTFLYYMCSETENTIYKLNQLKKLTDKNTLLNNIIIFHIANKQKQYYNAYNIISYLRNIYKNDTDIFYLYILSIMNIGNFYLAEQEINLFYKNNKKDPFYYSLLMNINAIKGNFKNALKIIENGRELYPDSKILLNDALNLYSIIDSIKYKKLKE